MHNYITFLAGHDVIWLMMLVALAICPHPPLDLAFDSGYLLLH